MEKDKQGFFKNTQLIVEEYVKERLLLLKLQTAEKAAKLTSVILTGFIIGAFILVILLLVSIITGYFLTELTGNWYFGFGIVTVFYILLAAVLTYFRNALLN